MSASTSAPTPDQILQTGLAFWASKALLSAVEMEHPRSARDFLDSLVALGFLERQDGHYANTPSSDLFLDRHKPSYVGGMLEMANKRLYGLWSRLTVALRTGERQSEEPGEADVFAAL